MGTKFIQGTLDATLLKENGKALTEIYATKDSINSLDSKYASKTDLANYVRTSGDQNVAGNKTFTGVSRFKHNVEFDSYVAMNSYWISNARFESKKCIQNNGVYMNGTLDLHPEGDSVIFPYYMNDLAYLVDKGGACVVKRQKENTTEWLDVPEVDAASLFNGTSSYTGYKVDSINDKLVILIKSHKNFSFGTKVGISFGSAWWRAKNISIDMGYLADRNSFDTRIEELLNATADETGLTTTDVATNSIWLARKRITDYEYGSYTGTSNGPMINGSPSWNIIRITLTNFNDTRSAADKANNKQIGDRLAGVYAINYSSEGLNTTLLGRKGGELYGDLIPYKNQTWSLGNNTHYWKMIYGQNIMANYIAPQDGDNSGGLGNSTNRWNTVWANNIRASNVYLNGENIKNQFTPQFNVSLNRATTVSGTQVVCEFFNCTFNANYQGYSFELLVQDVEAKQDVASYFIYGRRNGSATDITCKIKKIYGDNNYIQIFGTFNDNTLRLYVATSVSYLDPTIFISNLRISGDIPSYTFAKGTDGWVTNTDPQKDYEETYLLDSRYLPKSNAVTLSTAQTIYGVKTFTGANLFTNETKFTSGGTSWSDVANGITKSSCFTRGAFMEAIAGQIIAPNKAYINEEKGYNTEVNKIKFQKIDSITADYHPITSDMAVLTPEGLYVTGKVYSNGNLVPSEEDITSFTKAPVLNSETIAMGLIYSIMDYVPEPTTANADEVAFFTNIINEIQTGHSVAGAFIKYQDYATYLKLDFANVEQGLLQFSIMEAIDKKGNTYGVVYEDNGNGGGTITFSKHSSGIQSDWNENDTSSEAYIKNKPTIPTKSSWNYDDSYVKYSAAQTLTDAQKTQARSNIGAGTSSFTGYTSSNKLSTDYINNKAGWTSNAGTVTSVQVQAGTGLSSSVSTAQTSSLNTTISIASGYKLPTTAEWGNIISKSATAITDATTTGSGAAWIFLGGGGAGWASGGTYIQHNSQGSSSKNIVTLPDSNGTLALTSDIPTYNNATTTAAGFMSADDKKNLTYYVKGTQTAATGSWTGTLSQVSALYEGLTIRYKLPYAGSGDASLNLTLADGTTTGAKAIYRYGTTTRITTHFAAGSIITMTYNGTNWIADAFYYTSDGKVRQYTTTTAAEYPMLFAYETTLPSSYDTKYVRKATGFTYNPSTKLLTIPTGGGIQPAQGVIFGANDADQACIISPERKLCVGTDELDGDYIEYQFPENSGTVALTSDIPTVTKKYLHTIHITASTSSSGTTTVHMTLSFVNSVATAYTGVRGSLDTALYSAGFNSDTKLCVASGSFVSGSNVCTIKGARGSGSSGLYVYGTYSTYSGGTHTLTSISTVVGMYSATINDVVTEI